MDSEAVPSLDRETVAQVAALGVDMPVDAPVEDDDVTEVWDVNWRAVIIFMACVTQWRVAASASAWLHLGLDYAGVEVAMRQLMPAEPDPHAIFADVLVMESAALPVLNEGVP